MMLSILHKKKKNKLAHKVEMLKHMTLEVLQPKIKTNPNSQHLNKPYRISPSFISDSAVKNKEGAEEGLNNYLPLERGAYLIRRVNRGYTV